MSPFRSFPRFALVSVMAGLIALPSAHAEGPMNTDDAGTLAKGGMKLEGVWSADDETRGGEIVFGFSPLEKLELEVAASRANDGSANPDTKLRGVGFGAKWVPYQNDKGWSFGGRFDYGRTRVTDDEAAEKFHEHEYALTGLASYRLENGQVLHLNLGGLRTRAQGESDTVATWSVGYEFPLMDKLQLTVETFGQEHSSPDKAVGLRYEIADGLKISAAFGRGGERNFGQAGVAWEF